MAEKVKLQNVRLAFPNLWSKDKYGKYSANFLMDKDSPAHKAIVAGVKKVIETDAMGKSPGSKNLCYHPGSDKDNYDGYTDDNFYVSASRPEPFKPNQLIHRDKSPIETESVLYAGCYVNAVVNLWYQSNEHAKKVNAELVGIQFYKDGERFGRSATNIDDDDFDSLPDLEGEESDGNTENVEDLF